MPRARGARYNYAIGMLLVSSWGHGNMNEESLQPRVKSLEVQLSVLKAQMTATTGASLHRFGELYGMLAGTHSTDEGIRKTE